MGIDETVNNGNYAPQPEVAASATAWQQMHEIAMYIFWKMCMFATGWTVG